MRRSIEESRTGSIIKFSKLSDEAEARRLHVVAAVAALPHGQVRGLPGVSRQVPCPPANFIGGGHTSKSSRVRIEPPALHELHSQGGLAGLARR